MKMIKIEFNGINANHLSSKQYVNKLTSFNANHKRCLQQNLQKGKRVKRNMKRAQQTDIFTAKQTSNDQLILQTEIKDNKILFKARIGESHYVGEKIFDPDVDINKIKSKVEYGDYEMVNKTSQSLKLTLGFWTLELKAKKIKSIDQIQEEVMDLNKKMAFLTQQNKQLRRQNEQFKKQMREQVLQLQKKFQCKDPLLYRPKIRWDMMKYNSNIVTTQTEQKRIRGFFGHKDFSARLLYRASENKFLVSKFHQKCDGIQSTLVLCQTQFGNKIGGYTSLSWQSPLQEQKIFTEYSPQKTFIFSLTHNDKFKLMDGKCIIKNDRNQGPCFGSYSFSINKLAHKFVGDYFYLDDSFYNWKYTKQDDSSYEKIIGGKTQDNDFKISEWQVWQVIFPDNYSDEQLNSNQQNEEKSHDEAQEEDQQSSPLPLIVSTKVKKITKTKK